MLTRARDWAWLLRQDRKRRRDVAERRRRQLAFYPEFFRPGSLVFDVGANVGERTDVFVTLGARVVAFEPLPRLAAGLTERFARNESVHVRETALGAAQGTARLQVGDELTISTMSDAWREAVVSSGRFTEHRWETAIDVQVSTLDAEIARHGSPVFCKIDVEGFELEVLLGLSTALPAVSLEYTHEQPDVADACVHRLAEIGEYQFAFSPGESMVLWPAGWCSLDVTLAGLRSLPEPLPWGDLYARLVPA